jgi:hypothetical protein
LGNHLVGGEVMEMRASWSNANQRIFLCMKTSGAVMRIAVGREILCRDGLADREKVLADWRGTRPRKNEHA